MKHKYYVECTVVDKYSNKYNINYVYYYQMAFTLGFASVNFNLSYARLWKMLCRGVPNYRLSLNDQQLKVRGYYLAIHNFTKENIEYNQ